ncbi:ABC transporter substrate-binding protein [Ferviditalea candida]|uniref:ABC transporter substrate-binding protein n=1 Tax=Ferviditalea candida TaxID=3108399 RepID=A0ABU5ZQ43_9BACL|nr:ABC transporter substrate-binding protein [Paenibacillaceae bacterium T2]
MRKKLGMIVILLLWIALVGCSASSPSNETKSSQAKPSPSGKAEPASGNAGDMVKIGVVLAETGPASGLGKPEIDAIRLVKKKLEAQGGMIGGKKVEIIMKDYETDDTKAVLAMRKLIADEGVSVVYGATQVSTSIALRDIALKNNVVFLSGAPIGQLGETVFQTGQTSEVLIQQMIDYLKSKNIHTVAWINARDAFGQSGLPIMKKLAEPNGIEIVDAEDFDASATDMTVQLSKIKAKNPGALIVWSRTPGAGVVVKNFKQLGFTIPMLQSQAAANDAFLKQVGADGEGVLVQGSKASVAEQLPDSEYKNRLIQHNQEMMAEYNYPGDIFTTKATDAMNIIFKAIEAGNTTSDQIRDFLENQLHEYQGLSGTFRYTKENHAAVDDNGVSLLPIHNGAWSYSK